ncbi:glycosyltransferase [Candidatus Peregrinibacteria bacterium]|nr:glycosyltransferase [Candidatus Peregrinibacteria bacterium]
MRIALVHDFLVKLGGAERVLKALADLFPSAPIYTLLYDEKSTGHIFPKNRIRTSFFQKLPSFITKKQRYLLPFFPKEIEMFEFRDFDMVISSSSAFAHGIIVPQETAHLCYCHSPMRYAWDWTHEYRTEQHVGPIRQAAMALLLKKIRMWDQIAKDRPDRYLANSRNVQARLRKYYRLDSTVVYPPVDIDRFNVHKGHEDYFLIISTLTPYKRIELAILLFNKLKRHLIIVGDGSDTARLQNLAGKTIEFTGFRPDDVVTEYLQNCRALIFPGEDDLGIVPVEAMACGKPVLAYGKGGALETVLSGKTGEFFSEPTVESMEDGLARLLAHEKEYNPDVIRQRAEEFRRERFEKEIQQEILPLHHHQP